MPPATLPPGGTTSACAENTKQFGDHVMYVGNYLRVRGEYSRPRGMLLKPLELPPRARRILLDAFPSILKKGTTSACAENTGRRS